MHGHSEEARKARRLPSVDRVLRTPLGEDLVARFGHAATVGAVRDALAVARESDTLGISPDGAASAAEGTLEERNAPRLKPVFNLTGTVLHTNLGRALIAEEAIAAATEAMRNAVALEFDVEEGRRGERDDLVRDLICELTGAEDATVVNNNAAAVLLVLNTFAEGKGAIVSRGELIEIGGAFRMPEIMARAGARLVEIGTTNRTHKRDYENAVNEETGLLMKVHTSNYRIEGFTKDVPAKDLVDLARASGIPLVDDLGSGTLVDLARFGLPHEPTVAEAVAAGADIVTFSGDKLLGGPQAGFIVGRKALIEQINRNPLKRALRVDKVRLAAIEATLRLYRDPNSLAEKLPTCRHLARTKEEIEACARRVAPQVAEMLGPHAKVEIAECASQVGSGAVPVETLPSAGLALKPAGGGGALDRLAARLRKLPMPVIGRIAENALLLDLRCLEDETAFLRNFSALDANPESISESGGEA
ncbi:MAG: L-seryl-tRNA(Sec) selenium transferase [Ahrensia sp.]|nr:L-seryl-tRNA(Sec) selenium transferase [Ahrensia sp.]